VETLNVNEDNPWYGTPGGEDTMDYIFPLSIGEVVRYFGDSGQLENGSPNGGWHIDDEYNDARMDAGGNMWWLRSPGSSSGYATVVNNRGQVSVYGSSVSSFEIRLRPAMWITM
ncbi:MAG: DUF6273 domain-containing protein, partial [Oscillospiraceae bacterium]|nr:DUF6273 domain-containing protein [Oscillospiraceae bacterium]